MWRQYWPVYTRLEQEVCDLTFLVALADSQLNVYSIKFAELIMRTCGECENVAKALIQQRQFAIPPRKVVERLTFPEVGNVICSNLAFNTINVLVKWDYQNLTNKSILPFSTWSSARSRNPSWYDAYNKIKHDRHANIGAANFRNVIDALSALFALNLWLRENEITSVARWIVMQREIIESYSSFFSPNKFLKLGNGGTTKVLKFEL